jgi:hypothetical protein
VRFAVCPKNPIKQIPQNGNRRAPVLQIRLLATGVGSAAKGFGAGPAASRRGTNTT